MALDPIPRWKQPLPWRGASHVRIRTIGSATQTPRRISSTSRQAFNKRILLKTFGYGNIDMIYCLREDGSDCSVAAALKSCSTLAGPLEFWGKLYRRTDIVPFSAFYMYQRSDSRQGSKSTASLVAFYRANEVQGIKFLPEIWPKRLPLTLKEPEEFRDRRLSGPSETLDVETLRRAIFIEPPA